MRNECYEGLNRDEVVQVSSASVSADLKAIYKSVIAG